MRDNDENFNFEVKCTACGCEYNNLEGDACPNCSSLNTSHSSEDAERWNKHLQL